MSWFEQRGKTCSVRDVEAVRLFVKAAKMQGFTVEPTYKTESIESAAKLTLDNFVMQTISRDGGERKYPEASVSAWGPDGLAVDINPHCILNILQRLQMATKKCGTCGAISEETFRYAFANRMCKKCRSENKEPDNWCD